MVAALKELQSNPLFAREFLNATWLCGRRRRLLLLHLVRSHHARPRHQKQRHKRTLRTPARQRNTPPCLTVEHDALSGRYEMHSKRPSGILDSACARAACPTAPSAITAKHILPSTQQDADGLLRAKSDAGFIRLTGQWRNGASWMRGNYSDLHRMRVQASSASPHTRRD